MKVTTGNVLQGVVKAVKTGAVNDEIDIELKGGLNVAAIVTCRSTEKLGLRPGREVLAMVKGVNVLLARDTDEYVFSSGTCCRQGESREERGSHGQRRGGTG